MSNEVYAKQHNNSTCNCRFTLKLFNTIILHYTRKSPNQKLLAYKSLLKIKLIGKAFNILSDDQDTRASMRSTISRGCCDIGCVVSRNPNTHRKNCNCNCDCNVCGSFCWNKNRFCFDRYLFYVKIS